MTGCKDLEGAVDAVEYTRRSLGNTLRAAREAAGLTQAELAEKLGKAQPNVSGAEAGRVRVGEKYVSAVLKACGLPPDWRAPRKRGGK
jgi:transcriptional regulator with XRE-family HTH domain